MDLQNSLNCSQPTLVTKRREKGFCHRLHRCQSTGGRAPRFPCANRKAAQRQGCATLASARTAARDSQQQDARAVVWCRGKEHTSQGQGARSSTFKEPFTPIYFYTRWLKKKKKEAPIGCSYRSLGFYRLSVGD